MAYEGKVNSLTVFLISDYDYGRTLVELGPENDDSDIRFGDSEGFAAASAETQPLDGEYDCK